MKVTVNTKRVGLMKVPLNLFPPPMVKGNRLHKDLKLEKVAISRNPIDSKRPAEDMDKLQSKRVPQSILIKAQSKVWKVL